MATLNYILERIEAKKDDYARYSFTTVENNVLTAFFDLAQEFDGIEDFYRLCVAIPRGFFGLDARLYVAGMKSGDLVLVAQTGDEAQTAPGPPPPDVQPSERPYYTADRLILTIRGKKSLMDQLPFRTRDDVLGLLEIYPMDGSNPHSELFFEKYANRIGFNIHNRFLVEKNIEHLRFIRTLVADIEHNIIAPNMVYRLYLKHLRRKVMKNIELENLFSGCAAELEDKTLAEPLLAEMNEVNRGLMDELENLEKHYVNMSLFLETLLRRSHFDEGHLTLRTRSCNMYRDVVQPQIERLSDRFRQMGIEVAEQLSGIPEEEMISVVDIGLMAQVYANLFSNALKYTEEVVTHEGERKKYVSYGHELIRDFFGPGRDGVKYNVFSTGPHIPHEERERIFEDEYRGRNAVHKPGTGHGLAFVRNVVEIHNGVVGYEPTQYGNNFYFILPR